MLLQKFIEAMETIAPLEHAESWDNVGLLVGDPNQSISRALLTIDYTPEVSQEAKSANCDVILAYHPPIFDALKRVTADGPASLIHDAIRRDVAIYSPHTALDVADGGTNDVLADAIGLTQRSPLKLILGKAKYCKLIVFVPKENLPEVSAVIFAAGAGANRRLFFVRIWGRWHGHISSDERCESYRRNNWSIRNGFRSAV